MSGAHVEVKLLGVRFPLPPLMGVSYGRAEGNQESDLSG